jgi:hypothetical protein
VEELHVWEESKLHVGREAELVSFVLDIADPESEAFLQFAG